MNRILVAIGLMLALYHKAMASTDVNVVGSTPTFSGVQCTTGTAVRIDNWIHGSTNTPTSTRIGVGIQNGDATNAIWIGFDSNVSTHSTTAAGQNNLGQKLASGDYVYKGALRAVQIWCQAADAAGAGGVYVHNEQWNKE